MVLINAAQTIVDNLRSRREDIAAIKANIIESKIPQIDDSGKLAEIFDSMNKSLYTAINHLEQILKLNPNSIGIQEAEQVMNNVDAFARNLAAAKYHSIEVSQEGEQQRQYFIAPANQDAISASINSIVELLELYSSELNNEHMSFTGLDIPKNERGLNPTNDDKVHRAVLTEALFEGINESPKFLNILKRIIPGREFDPTPIREFAKQMSLLKQVKEQLPEEVSQQRALIQRLAYHPDIVDQAELIYQDLRSKDDQDTKPYLQHFIDKVTNVLPNINRESLISAITERNTEQYFKVMSELKDALLDSKSNPSQIVRATLILQRLKSEYTSEFHPDVPGPSNLKQVALLQNLANNDPQNYAAIRLGHACKCAKEDLSLNPRNIFLPYQVQDIDAKIHIRILSKTTPELEDLNNPNSEINKVIDRYRTIFIKAIVPEKESSGDPIKERLHKIIKELHRGETSSLLGLINSIKRVALEQNTINPSEAADLITILSQGLGADVERKRLFLLYLQKIIQHTPNNNNDFLKFKPLTGNVIFTN